MSDFTSARSFILREARLDVLDPGRSEMSRLINDAATKFCREWSRATEARLLSAAIGLADEYAEWLYGIPVASVCPCGCGLEVDTGRREPVNASCDPNAHGPRFAVVFNGVEKIVNPR